MYLKCASSSPYWTHFLNIQIIFSARPSITNMSETCLHCIHPFTLHINVLFSSQHILPETALLLYLLLQLLLLLYTVASMQARFCLVWSPK